MGTLKQEGPFPQSLLAPFPGVTLLLWRSAQLSREAALTILAMSNATITSSPGTMYFSFIALILTAILHLFVQLFD